MGVTDFSRMPAGRHEDFSIAVCPKCGRNGRVERRPGGGRVYDHVASPLEPAVGGVHVEIIEWCEEEEPADS
jgi:hypothetical protein